MLESMFSAIQSVGTAASTDVDTMESRSQEFCDKLAAIGVNTAELKEIFECNGNSLIVSGAGSGKTTALVLKILHDLYCGYCYKTVEIPSVTGDNYVKVTANILVTTFLKSGAEDLKRSFFEWAERLNIRGFDSSKIVFKTLHAEVYQALVAMTGIKPEIVADGQKYIRAVMKKYGIRSVLSRSRTVTLEEVRDIECILSYARNRLDDEKYSHPLMSDYKLDSTVLEAIIKDTKLQRQLEQVSDYEDMQELLLDALKKYPNVRSNIASRYDYIYCDEFQDTSQLQYAILQYYIDGAKRITAIGDDDQCIYSWRGSDINIITKFFIADFKPCVFRLMTNYRCKSNILNAVVPSITKNVNRVEKSLKAYKDGGTVDVLLNYPVSHLIDAVKKDVYANKTVGILSRTNNDLLVPALILELDGSIDFSVSKQLNIRGRLPRFVFGCIELLTKRYTDSFEDYFSQVLPLYGKDEASRLSMILKMNKDITLYNISEADLVEAVPNLYNSLLKVLRGSHSGDTLDKSAYIEILWLMRDTFLGATPYACKARELIDYVINLVQSEICAKLTLYEIDNLFNNIIPTRLASRVKGTAQVKLSTIHEAKGKEWDSVYIWNDNDGVFPAQVGQRTLTDAEYEEERRIHYIAWTRAKDSLTVYANSDKLSPFLDECDVELKEPDYVTKEHKVF